MRGCRYLLLLFIIVISSCRVGPRYHPPCIKAPDEWKGPQSKEVETPHFTIWWEVFHDDTLNELQQLAIRNNPNLYVALQNVFYARAQADVEAANLYPQLNFNPSFVDFESLFQIYLPNALSLPSLPKTVPPYRVHQMQYQFPLNMSYEVDLWGKLRDQYDAASFNAQAEAQAYCTTLLTLTTDLASAYFQLRSLDAQMDLLKANIATRKKNLDLTQTRFKWGLINYLDVTQAEVDLADVEASYEEIVRLRGVQEDQLAVLTGQIASNFTVEHLPLEGAPPEIPAGIPSTILFQRPDIAEAEREMASQHALINAAYASFFPSLSLTGALGFLSPDIKQFFMWLSRYWALGANASQVAFDGGRDYATLQGTYAKFYQANGAYQQQIITAFKEVEDALISIEQQSRQSEKLFAAVRSSKQAVALSTHRYIKGVAIYLEVVENERLELEAEVKWVSLQGDRFVSTIQLIKALGGSWMESKAENKRDVTCDG